MHTSKSCWQTPCRTSSGSSVSEISVLSALLARGSIAIRTELYNVARVQQKKIGTMALLKVVDGRTMLSIDAAIAGCLSMRAYTVAGNVS